MITIDKQHISRLMLLEVYSEKNKTEQRINFFQNKYQKKLHEFEKFMQKTEEKFSYYDDYMEWKAYVKYLTGINKKIEDLRDGNIKVA
ncbi:MAG: hypothetical protein PF690_00355 [Deltaproteobacteria bacterium]|jgi:hypothetical protein|nr:hypothetical protein [Deltaproteobacteria bacterium]